MVAVAEMEWQDVMNGTFPENPARTAFREAVATVADRARAALPEANGRIETGSSPLNQGERCDIRSRS